MCSRGMREACRPSLQNSFSVIWHYKIPSTQILVANFYIRKTAYVYLCESHIICPKFFLCSFQSHYIL